LLASDDTGGDGEPPPPNFEDTVPMGGA